MNKRILLGLAASTLCLLACSDNTASSSTTTNTTGTTTNTGTSPVNVSVVQTSPIALNVAQSYYVIGSSTCNRGGTLAVTYTDTVHVARVDSSLFAWHTNDCRAERYIGTDTTITGLWIFAGIGQIPSDTNIAKNCQQIYSSNYPDSLRLAISDSTLVKTYTDNGICWAIQDEGTVSTVLNTNYATNNISVTTSGCNTINVHADSTNATLTLTKIDAGTAQQHITFAYNGKTCDYSTVGTTTLDSTTCAAAWTTYLADATAPRNFNWTNYVNNTAAQTAFNTCVAATGWNYGPLLFAL